jgi:hypothetical protein
MAPDELATLVTRDRQKNGSGFRAGCASSSADARDFLHERVGETADDPGYF